MIKYKQGIKNPFLTLSLILLLSSFTQKGKDDYIIKWSCNRPLTFTDFHINKQNNTGDAALSNISITIQSVLGEKIMTSIVYAYFDKRSSWISQSYKDSATLRHEQIHFDIAEINARKFREQLLSMKFTAENFRVKSNEVYKMIIKNLNKEQALFDKEYKVGGEKKELEWSEKVKNDLNEYNEYKNNVITIPLYE